MSDALGSLYGTIDSYKRRLVDALRNPRLAAEQAVGNANDKARAFNELTSQATDEALQSGDFFGPKGQQLAQVLADSYNPVGMMKVVGPQSAALETARKNAVKMLGLPENNTAMDRASALGFDDFFHGTERLDRLLSKKGIDPKRATSGPMPYGTVSKDLASNYAKNKPDTSRIANDNGDFKNYFQVSPKDLGFRGTSPYSVEQSWNYLPQGTKAEILDKARRVGYENLDDFSGALKLHPPGTDATLSASQYDWVMKNEARGNPLTALRSIWHDSGALFDSPEELASIYKLAGFPHEISQANAPWFTANGVLTGKARITNPLDTSDAETMKNVVIPALKDAFKGDRTRLKVGADAWDKNSRFTPKEWVKNLEADVSDGKNSYVWTSIPDKVTNELRKLGFNGIVDQSGKGAAPAIGEKVIIPFDPNQVRSRFAAFDPARINENNLLAGMLPLGALAVPDDTKERAKELIEALRKKK